MSKWRCVQRAEAGRELGVVIYLAGPGVDADRDGVGDLDEALAAALPGVGIAATVESGYQAVPSDLTAALAACGASKLGALVGFSGGCQGVRAHLWRGAEPRAVVCLDGTSARWPEPDPPQIDVWRRVAGEARVGLRTVVLTCTAQRYTERLTRAQGGPFAATSTVLARALDWPEAGTYPASPRPLAVYPAEPVLQLNDRDLHAYAYPGTDCDAAAHVAQLVRVLPWVLAEHVRPVLGVKSSSLADYTIGAGRERLSDLGAWLAGVAQHVVESAQHGPEEHLRRALAEVGVHETPGPVSTPRIDEYLSVCVRGGRLLGLRGDSEFSWCAAFASWCGLPPGMTPRAAVAELVADARKLGLWRSGDVWHDPQPGDLAVYGRAGQDPRTGGSGHVNRYVEQLGGGRWRAVGGNETHPSGGAVVVSERALTEPVGWIVYPR